MDIQGIAGQARNDGYSLNSSRFPTMKKSSSPVLLLFLSILLFLTSCSRRATHTVWLDELDMTNADQAAGQTRINQSMWRTPLIIAADTFERGVGTHAFGMIRIALDGKTQSFETRTGIDDSAPEHELKQASVEFQIVGDNRILWESGVMHAGDTARYAKVSLRGIRSLILYTLHADDGITGDRADWVDARFEVAGANPYTTGRPREAEYILTPEESPQPHINAPYRLGVRAKNPILFTIPVSGQRPVKIEIENLPPSLKLDEQTGVLSGNLPTEGTYNLKVKATNLHGQDTNELQIAAGEKIALTPPMGWSSWNVYGADIDDTKIRAMADALIEQGLNQYGYSYINIDDGWQGKRGGKYNAIQPNEKFPDMKALAGYVHSKGLKIGIYSSPWVQTFAGYVGGSADTHDGKIIDSSRRTGKYSFAENDVKQWAEWGFDYLKYDWVTNDVPNTTEMSNLLKNSGRDVVFSISNAAPFELASDWARLTHVWRTTGDIFDSWCSLTTIGFLQNKWQPYTAPGAWNDPDMLVAGKLGWGDSLRTTRLSPDEQYVHLSLWSLLAAPLIMGCELTQLDDFTLKLLTNREVIAVNQDVLGAGGTRIYKDYRHNIEIWAKPLSDGSQAVGFFNLGEQKQNISVSWEQLKIQGEYKVRDLWKQKNLGNFDGELVAQVPAHGVSFVKVYQ
ncbi:alpha-galactosidase [Bacteroidia bacterium]|nr:alpha-galactosidase [Bacteroidia bacterium]